jgi:hypothetical protein
MSLALLVAAVLAQATPDDAGPPFFIEPDAGIEALAWPMTAVDEMPGIDWPGLATTLRRCAQRSASLRSSRSAIRWVARSVSTSPVATPTS